MKSLRSEVKQSGAGVVSFCLVLFLYYIAVLVFDAPNSPLVTNLRKKFRGREKAVRIQFAKNTIKGLSKSWYKLTSLLISRIDITQNMRKVHKNSLQYIKYMKI